MIVDPVYYYNVYMGQEADQASFPALCARAEDVIGTMTRWQATEENFPNMPPFQKTLVKKAICAQIDFFAVNGIDSVVDNNENGFTVGKVRIGGSNSSFVNSKRRGVMENHISPMVVMYLEQSGLMNPTVPVVQGAMP